MRLSAGLAAAVAVAVPAAAGPPGGCTERREWRAIPRPERRAYIEAVKCLQAKPPRLGHLYPGVRSRFDDFQALHIQLTPKIHWNAPFLPWHRVYLDLYDRDLRSTCGYRGAQPYWDWSLDAVSEAAVLQSPIFDPVYGFGGNGPYISDAEAMTFPNLPFPVPGRTGGGCISSGPFKNRNVSLGMGSSLAYDPQCLRRDISPWLLTIACNTSTVNHALASPNFFEFNIRIQGGLQPADIRLHGGGHIGVGGNTGYMSSVTSSPGDPIFFLHHANLDRLWDIWQRKNWPARKTDFSGPDNMWAYPFNFFGDIPYANVTLDWVLEYGALAPNRTVRSVMDARQFC